MSASSSTISLDVRRGQQALAGEVEQAAGGADDDLRAGLELLDLALVGLAAVDRDDVGGAVARRRARGLRRPARTARGSGRRRAPCTPGAGSRPRRWMSGRPKPKVLPVPVLAWPMMSWPARPRGMVWVWMGKGSMMPLAARASTMSWSMSRSAKVKELCLSVTCWESAARCGRRGRADSRRCDCPTGAEGPAPRRAPSPVYRLPIC